MPAKTRKHRSDSVNLKPPKPMKSSSERPLSSGKNYAEATAHPRPSANSFAPLSTDVDIDASSKADDDPDDFPPLSSFDRANKPSSAPALSVNNSELSNPPSQHPYADALQKTPTISLDDRFQSMLQMIQLQQQQLTHSSDASDLRYRQLDNTTTRIHQEIERQSASSTKILERLNSHHSAINHLIHSKEHSIAPLPSHDSINNAVNQNVRPLSPPVFATHSHHQNHEFTIPPHGIKTQSPTHKASPPSTKPSNNIFGSNIFALACSGKIKYSAIETALKTKVLVDDSTLQLERFYSGVIRAVCYAFENGLDILPPFIDLDQNLDFESLFLNNLVGSNLTKCRQVFLRIGEILKDRFNMIDCISKEKCPKAAIVINANPVLGGWDIFEKLLRSRVVSCGALPDEDIDVIRTSMTLRPNESVHEFYSRNQSLITQYQFRYRSSSAIPRVKILVRFLQELQRCQDFVPYLVGFQRDITSHLRSFGDIHHQEKLRFDIDDVYSMLDQSGLSMLPTKLRPSPTSQSSQSVSPPIPVFSSNPPGIPTIASCEYDPSIHAFTSHKRRCQVCLMGFHQEDDCYLRGPNFIDPALQRRINIYNQNCGDKPPPGHKVKEWKPQSIPPFEFNSPHKSRKQVDFSPSSSSQIQKPSLKKQSKPFSNASTKALNKPSISTFESSSDFNASDQTIDEHATNLVHLDTMGTPSMASFISSQEQAVESLQLVPDSDDPYHPTCCSMDPPIKPSLLRQSPSHQLLRQSTPLFAVDFTPHQLRLAISNAHSTASPSKQFFLQHSQELHNLSLSNVKTYGSSIFHCDSGANCWGMPSRDSFYFYIDNPTSISQVNGSTFQSPGWGGILIRLNNRIYGMYPVHHCPGNPRNTMSPSSIKEFSGFKKAILSMNDSIQLIDFNDHLIDIPILTHNDMDYVELEILHFNAQPNDPSINAATSLRRSPRLQSLSSSKPPPPPSPSSPPPSTSTSPPSSLVSSPHPSSSLDTLSPDTIRHDHHTSVPNKLEFIFPQSVMIQIASYYVELHDISSPREVAIRRWNTLLGHPIRNLHSPAPPVNIPGPTQLQTHQRRQQQRHPVMSKFSRPSIQHFSPVQEYIHLHLATMHSSKSTLEPLLRKNLLNDLPAGLIQNLNHFECSCFICALRKSDKIPKGRLVDKTLLAPFQRLHVDFSFFSVTSIRGFTSSLDIRCGSTSFPFAFPSKGKNPPLDVIRFTINTLRSQGFQVNFIRVDEDRALALSSEFCELILELGCVLETTSGGNSTNNGVVERGNRVNGNMIRTALTTLKSLIPSNQLPNDFKVEELWCFALQHSVFVQRRMYNRLRKDIPYFLVWKKRPSARDLVIFGSFMTIVNPQKHLLPKLDNGRAYRANFLGYNNNDSDGKLFWSHLTPRKYYRSHHSKIDVTSTLASLQEHFASPALPSLSRLDSSTSTSLATKIISPKSFDCTDTKFPGKKVSTFSFTLPPFPTPIGALIRDDLLLNMPFIQTSVRDSPIYNALPPSHRHNQFILSINAEGPITTKFAVQLLQSIQKSPNRQLTIDLVHRGPADTASSLQMSRAIFDSFPTLTLNRPIMNTCLYRFTSQSPSDSIHPLMNQMHTISSHDHFITSASKPATPRSFFDAIKSPFRRNWKAAAWNQFQKNQKIAVFSLPVLRNNLSDDTRIFRSQLIPEIKPTDVPSVFELKIRDVICGTPQEKDIDFKESYSPVVDPTTIRIQLAFTCAKNYHIAIIDVKNAFQNTIAPPASRIWVTVPPTYLEFLSSTEGFIYDRDEQYVRQMLNANQGTKDAGNLWYSLFSSVISKYGMTRSTVDHGLFAKQYEDGSYLYVSLATDDLLCAFKTYRHFEDFERFLKSYFTLTVQTGSVLKFLGIRIIQSDQGISLDQGEYIYDMLVTYFGENVDKIKTSATPMRSESDLEQEFHDAIPLSPHELKEYSIKHRGSYRFWTGTAMFAACITRFDILFAVQRLSEFNNAPTAAAFREFVRILRYLAKDIIRPIMFPRETFEKHHSVSYFITPESHMNLEISNLPTLFTDAELARDITTRKSYYCTIITVLNVIVQMKVKKTTRIMQHTTDAELNGAYVGVRHLKPIRQLFAFMGAPLGEPSTLHVDNAAVASIIDSGRLTPRTRHFDIPIALLQSEKDKEFYIRLLRTQLMLADMGTKPNKGPALRRFKYWGMGARFYPSPGHPHYIMLQLQFYELNFVEVVKLWNSN
jgi:hypothetical protein